MPASSGTRRFRQSPPLRTRDPTKISCHEDPLSLSDDGTLYEWDVDFGWIEAAE
ncbi:MAG: hypothetical protein QF419_02635 [Acidimicrobiales bacterium]|nr:hypothetical protein [Acidimicrobiales bacterium]